MNYGFYSPQHSIHGFTVYEINGLETDVTHVVIASPETEAQRQFQEYKQRYPDAVFLGQLGKWVRYVPQGRVGFLPEKIQASGSMPHKSIKSLEDIRFEPTTKLIQFMYGSDK